MPARTSSWATLLPCLMFVALAAAGNPGTWQPAHCPSCEEGGTPAAEATCPASDPVSCSSISQDDYCCPTNNYCMWANSQVVCCPEGCDCSEQQSTSWPAPTTAWAPAQTTWHASWHPTTTWHSSWRATTTWYTPPVSTWTGSVTTTETGTMTACDECEWHPTNWNGVYCSTIYANGPNLPTTAHAACGVVLVRQPNDTVRLLIGWTKMLTMIIGLQLVGGFFLFWR